MNPTLAVIAERIHRRPNGRFDAIGIHVRTAVPKVPAPVDLVLVLQFDVTEADRNRTDNILSVHLLREDGHELVKLTSSPIDLRPRAEDGFRPIASLENSLPLKVNFPALGRYTFDIRHNGVSWVRLPYIIAVP